MPTGVYIRTKKYNLSDAVRKRISERLKGRKLSDLTKEKLRIANTGRKHPPRSEKWRKEHSEALKGRQSTFLGHRHSEKSKKKMSEALKGRIISETHKKKISESLLGREVSIKTKDKIRTAIKEHFSNPENRKKLSNSMMGHIVSDISKKKMRDAIRPKISKETKMKMRMAKLKYIEENVAGPSVGSNEILLLDRQEKLDNCKIDRNFSIIGYKPDGYCHETNTVYEVYEKYHDFQVQKDLERENRICNHLSCDFIILYDRTH